MNVGPVTESKPCAEEGIRETFPPVAFAISIIFQSLRIFQSLERALSVGDDSAV